MTPLEAITRLLTVAGVVVAVALALGWLWALVIAVLRCDELDDQ